MSINERVTCPPPAQGTEHPFVPKSTFSPNQRYPPESPLGREAIRRSVPFTARKKKHPVRLSRGSSPHNQRPSEGGGGGESPAAQPTAAPATKPRRRRLFPGISLPGTIRQRFSAHPQCRHCPLRSSGTGRSFCSLCKLPKAPSYRWGGPGDFVFLLGWDNRPRDRAELGFAFPVCYCLV